MKKVVLFLATVLGYQGLKQLFKINTPAIPLSKERCQPTSNSQNHSWPHYCRCTMTFHRGTGTEVLIDFLSWISEINWVHYLTIHNHSKRDTASDKQAIKDLRLRLNSQRWSNREVINFQLFTRTVSTLRALVMQSFAIKALQSTFKEQDTEAKCITWFWHYYLFFLLPSQRAMKFYDQHFTDTNDQYHTEVRQLIALGFSWPDSCCGNLGGHYWCRLAW